MKYGPLIVKTNSLDRLNILFGFQSQAGDPLSIFPCLIGIFTLGIRLGSVWLEERRGEEFFFF